MTPRSRTAWRGGGLIAAASAVVLLAPAAQAHDGDMSWDGAYENGKSTHAHHDQHGGTDGHLPATSENVNVVSKLELTNKAGHIADVGVHKGYAYLGGYWEPDCKQGGVYVADIKDPKKPKKVSFIGTSKGSYVGEGVHTVSISTPKFNGDLLAFNNEVCNAVPQSNGGMTLIDVTNPAEPKRLAEHVGDLQADGDAHEIHSTFIWDAGDKAYAVIVDDEEGEDVDIMDITDPRNPTMVREYDLDETFPQIKQATPEKLTQVFLHDMIVKEIAGRQVMLLSYWDGGYVTLDVTDPANATYIGDTDFTTPDPELLESANITADPEGNGHQAEFTKNNDYILAADEDFGPSFLLGSTDDGTEFEGGQGSGTPQLEAGESLSGTTVFGGRACPGDQAVPPAPAEAGNQIAVITRGVCTFTEKVAAVEAAGGYEGVIVVNRVASCGAFGMAVDGGIPAFSVDRKTGYSFFDKEGEYDEAECQAGDPESLEGSLIPGVAFGQKGDVVTLETKFDGWGYVHLYRNGTGKLAELDTYAIPEAHDPDFDSGFGDLSVHEVAVSEVQNNLAYFAYYAGGFRVTKIVDDEIQEVGRFIDQGGNNFWGVQVFQSGGKEYVAASDRDFGLYIFEYTGP